MRDHKEYERKPKGPLRKQVSRALAWCLEKREAGGGGGGAGAKQRGRPTTAAGAANGHHHHSAHGTAAQQRRQGSGRRGGWEEDEGEQEEAETGDEEEGEEEAQRGEEESGSDADFEREAMEREVRRVCVYLVWRMDARGAGSWERSQLKRPFILCFTHRGAWRPVGAAGAAP